MNTKNYITTALLKTERIGMEDLVEYMEDSGFFEAPCSGGNHLCCPGGLAEHTKNVMIYAQKIGKMLYGKTKYEEVRDSLIIASALHDLGKMGQYGKPYYTPNMIKDGRPTKAEPEQKYKQSEAKPYEINKDLMQVDHCIRSVILATMYIDLTEEEQNAILYHDGLYGVLKYEVPGHETPLMCVIHWADFWTSHFVEDSNAKG